MNLLFVWFSTRFSQIHYFWGTPLCVERSYFSKNVVAGCINDWPALDGARKIIDPGFERIGKRTYRMLPELSKRISSQKVTAYQSWRNFGNLEGFGDFFEIGGYSHKIRPAGKNHNYTFLVFLIS